MNKFSRTSCLCAALLFIATTVFGQGWPLPSKSPNTDVPCSAGNNPGCQSSVMTKGYPSSPFVGFVGRFVDSSATTDFQYYMRTIRAYGAKIQGDRMYIQYGSALASFDLARFVSRLSSGEAMVSAQSLGPNSMGPRTPNVWEAALAWDSFFNAEYEPSNGWQTPRQDGQDRLYNFDIDDNQYVYLAYSYFGWGIVHDTGSGLMPSVAQVYPTPSGPQAIAVVKTSGGKYYVLWSDKGTTALHVSDVTNRAHPDALPDLGNGMFSYAKTALDGNIAIIDPAQNLRIFSANNVATGGAPIASGPASGYNTVTSDGTNFYAIYQDSTNRLNYISTWAPAGNTYRETRYQIPWFNYPQGLRYGGGFLAISGFDPDFIRLYKVSGGVPAEVPTTVTLPDGSQRSYFSAYYGAAPPGYAVPYLARGWEAFPFKYNNHYYLMLNTGSIGDLYEIKGADTIGVTGPNVVGRSNPNAPAPAGAYYGDTLQFNSNASTAVSVNWNFGNGTPGGTADLTSTTGTAVTHQYANLTAGNFAPAPGNAATQVWNTTVTAWNPVDIGTAGTAAVQLIKPTPRFGINGTKLLFTQPNASSPAPIILGDTFFDGSDGTLDGHFDTWTFGASTQKTLPSDNVSVGDCGTRTLSFDAHYGPFTGSPGAYASTTTDFAVGIHGSGYDFAYLVRPFAAAMSVSSDASNIIFTNGSRASALMAASNVAALNWKWEVVGPNGVVLNGPSGTGFANIPNYTVPKSAFNATNLKAHLAITSPTDFGGACAGLTSTEAFSQPLNAPAVSITGGCTNGGPPCSFTASPAAGADPAGDGWVYQWSVSPSSGVNATVSNASTFTPIFTSIGNFTVTCTVTNSIGFTASPASPVNVTQAGPVCGTMTAGSTVFINYQGPTSNCFQNTPSVACTPGESIAFGLGTFGYDPSCATHTYSWDFGDGQSSTSAAPSHSYSAANTYTVRLTVNNGTQTVTLTQNVPVAGGGQQCNGPCGCSACPPPPPGGCATMTAANVFIGMDGEQSHCTVSNPTCQSGETVTFSIQTWGYSLGCANHTVSWNFGDGNSGSGPIATHTYSNGGSYTVVMTVSNGTQNFQNSQAVTITGGSVGCGPLAQSNVDVGWNGLSTGCSSSNAAQCAPGETINLSAVGVNYNFGCGAHTYAWSFSDGGTGTGQSTSHVFTNAGTYTATLRVTAPSGTSVTVTKTLNVNGSMPGGLCGTLSPATVFIYYSNGANTCSPGNAGNICSTNDAINFSLQTFNYNMNCANHTFSWDFGDNTTGTGPTPSHAYASTGTYTVKCTVNNGSASTTLSSTITISGSGKVRKIPSLDFTVTPIAAIPNAYVFTPIEDPAGIITKWVWDFGDGSTPRTVTGTAQAAVTYNYTSSGLHTVTLTGYDDIGALVTVAHTIGAERKRPSRH